MKHCKKLLLAAAFTAACTFALALPAAAEEIDGGKNWQVWFTGNDMQDNYHNGADFSEKISALQPGDSVHFTVNLQNRADETTDWYMTNKVLESLETQLNIYGNETNATGGAYTYVLTYTDQNGTEYTLYDSNTVGGADVTTGESVSVTGEIGLHEATDALEDYFFLDQLEAGEGGTIEVTVGLDGESQGNLYQDTQAQLQMNFAVELSTTPITRPTPPGSTENPSPTPSATHHSSSTPSPSSAPAATPRVRYVYTTAPQTGDNSNLALSAMVFAVSGLLLLALGIYQLRQKKRSDKH